MADSRLQGRAGDYQLRLSQQLGWAMGSMGTAVLLGALSTYAFFFMTNYLGMSVVLATLIIMASKVFDMVTDPIMGHISDRTNSRWGRRRPYLLIGAIVCPISLTLLFLIPDFQSTFATAAYIFVVLLIYATGFTLFNVPYLAMSAEMTTNPDERTLIMSWRIFFSTLGHLAIGAVAAYLIKYFGSGSAAYMKMSWVMAGVVFLAMGVTFFLTRDAKFLPPSPSDQYGLRRQWQFIKANRPFRFYMAAKICMFLSQTSIQGSLLFFAYYVLARDVTFMFHFSIGYVIGSIAALPVWNYVISRVIGKRNAYMIASIVLGFVPLSWLLSGPEENLVGLYARFLILGIFAAGSIVSASAMLPDIMEYDRRRTGLNQEGIYAAAFSLVEKIANFLGPMIVGGMLAATGFISAREGDFAEQPESAILAIKMTVSVVPFLLALTAAWFIRFYDLNDGPHG